MSADIDLKPCPFCGGAARIESNRDWHRLWADHAEDCVFDADEANLMCPATPARLASLVAAWNSRAAIPPSTGAAARVGERVGAIAGYLMYDNHGGGNIDTHFRKEKPDLEPCFPALQWYVPLTAGEPNKQRADYLATPQAAPSQAKESK